MVSSAKVYFATLDGRYIFAGPVFDTELSANIVNHQEEQINAQLDNDVIFTKVSLLQSILHSVHICAMKSQRQQALHACLRNWPRR
jgi:hypothetical protein